MLSQYELEAYKRQLVLDIKTAYYNQIAAEAAVKIYESALSLVNKNIEINESLLRNGKSLPANVMRSKSEAERVRADLNNARNQVVNARKYFNFLLNRDLDLEVRHVGFNCRKIFLCRPIQLQHSPTREKSSKCLKQFREINQSSLQMAKLNRLPKVNAFLDLGTQASDWKYNNDSRYYLVGVQLSLPIFQGFRNAINHPPEQTGNSENGTRT